MKSAHSAYPRALQYAKNIGGNPLRRFLPLSTEVRGLPGIVDFTRFYGIIVPRRQGGGGGGGQT